MSWADEVDRALFKGVLALPLPISWNNMYCRCCLVDVVEGIESGAAGVLVIVDSDAHRTRQQCPIVSISVTQYLVLEGCQGEAFWDDAERGWLAALSRQGGHLSVVS